MGKGRLEAIYGLMGWKGLRCTLRLITILMSGVSLCVSNMMWESHASSKNTLERIRRKFQPNNEIRNFSEISMFQEYMWKRIILILKFPRPFKIWICYGIEQIGPLIICSATTVHVVLNGRVWMQCSAQRPLWLKRKPCIVLIDWYYSHTLNYDS